MMVLHSDILWTLITKLDMIFFEYVFTKHADVIQLR